MAPKVDWLQHIMQRDFRLTFRFEGRSSGQITAWIEVGRDPEIGPVVIRPPRTDSLGRLLGEAINLIIDADDEPPPTN